MGNVVPMELNAIETMLFGARSLVRHRSMGKSISLEEEKEISDALQAASDYMEACIKGYSDKFEFGSHPDMQDITCKAPPAYATCVAVFEYIDKTLWKCRVYDTKTMTMSDISVGQSAQKDVVDFVGDIINCMKNEWHALKYSGPVSVDLGLGDTYKNVIKSSGVGSDKLERIK